MKPEKIYQELKDIADKIGVGVEEHNFRHTGIYVKSGACIVHGKHLVILDKHQSIGKKVRVLAAALSKFPHESVYTVPAVRDMITRFAEE